MKKQIQNETERLRDKIEKTREREHETKRKTDSELCPLEYE